MGQETREVGPEQVWNKYNEAVNEVFEGLKDKFSQGDAEGKYESGNEEFAKELAVALEAKGLKAENIVMKVEEKAGVKTRVVEGIVTDKSTMINIKLDGRDSLCNLPLFDQV